VNSRTFVSASIPAWTAATVPALLLVVGLVLAGCAHSRPGTAVGQDSVSALPATTTTTPGTTETTTGKTTRPATSDNETTTDEDTTTSTEDTTDDDAFGDGSGLADGTFDVSISGTVSGRSFTRSATLTIRPTITSEGTTNGVNDVDVCLVSGSPGAEPDVGAIWFGSNSACDPGARSADIDLGYVEVDGDTITLKPDERLAATDANNFTSSSGLAACLFAPVSGELSITTDVDGSVSGSLDVSGYGGALCGNSRYEADVSGSRS
jgi:hypothetical protein